MHQLSTSFIYGYHGCDRPFGAKKLAGCTELEMSQNHFDWLGPRVYFWESNPRTAIQFAQEKKDRGEKINEPFVIGAVIDLGNCLDLTSADSITYLKLAHQSLTETIRVQESGFRSTDQSHANDFSIVSCSGVCMTSLVIEALLRSILCAEYFKKVRKHIQELHFGRKPIFKLN